MKEVVSKVQLAKVVRLNEANPLLDLLIKFTGLNDLNELYDKVAMRGPEAFIPKIFESLQISIDCLEKDLEKVPKSGPFIIVSNHPFGALDGLVLIEMIGKLRPDLKVMANFLLEHVEELQEFFIGVNPFDHKVNKKSSYHGIKKAVNHLNKGRPLAIFPSGEVSTFQFESRTISDTSWSKQSIKLIQKCGVPVIPLFFDGSNSNSFHLLGMIHPALRTLRLPKELMKKKGQTIRMRIGSAISPASLAEFDSTEVLGKYLRARVYALGSGVEVKKDHFRRVYRVRKPSPVQDSPCEDELKAELAFCEDLKLFTRGQFVCYLAPARRIPKLLQEIGIQREHTFRAVGEGSNKCIDLDEYDYYYDHLFLWHVGDAKLVGAYRVGMGESIMARLGTKGFYTSSLFRYKQPIRSILPKCVELGRSFVRIDYQKHRLPLFLLWKGIMSILLQHPAYQYVIGPVSISNDYSDFSKGLIMEFIQRYHFNHDLAQYVKPKNQFVPKFKQADREALLNSTNKDLKKLDRLISDIEPSSFSVPVLLKKYLYQNAKILGFNSDPKFNNALDGLIFLDFSDIPASMIASLQSDLNEALT